MKIDFSTKLMNPDGTEVRSSSQNDDGRMVLGPVLTLGLVARTVLFANLPDDKSSGEEKFRRGKLGDEIWTATHAAGEGPALMDLSTDQLADIKQLVGKHYNSMVVARVWDLLEQKKKTIQ